MSIGTRARQALRRVAEWERERLGVSGAMPAPVRRRLKRMMRKSLLPEGRRFIASDGVEDFFRALNERGTSYVVVRWFEGLPERHDGDIDFLVADDAVHDFEQLMTRKGPGVPCDVYAESGASGYSYGGIAYYPPELARRILERRVTVAGCVSAPCPEDHFLSLAYHCVYRKGPDSGLPTAYASVRPTAAPKHDYRGTLAALANKVGLRVELDMESLDSFLAEQGWRPPNAVLERLAADNLWIHYRFGGNGLAGSPRKSLQEHPIQ